MIAVFDISHRTSRAKMFSFSRIFFFNGNISNRDIHIEDRQLSSSGDFTHNYSFLLMKT